MAVAVAARQRLQQVAAPQATPLALSTAMALPLTFATALALIGTVPSVRHTPTLLWSVLGAASVLLVGVAVLASLVARAGRTLAVEVSIRKQHYLQACAQGSVLLYWGWYWRPVYDAAPLLVAQLLFAYAFDILLAWSRRDTYTLGFAPFPVIFSINLFLWFRPEWFYLQFVMIAVGFLAKELIRWNKDGRRTHIFNPSSFPLAVFSIALILTGNTSMTWGVDIARTQFNPPNIYLMLFLIGLPGQYLFGVTTMTMSAVVTTYLCGLAYFAATGTYFFIDSYIPIAVFLGMHLLVTDPSTSPKTEVGRLIFGSLYGVGNVVLYELLRRAGLPAFYDKLLPVPILNLCIRFIDRVAQLPVLKIVDPARLGRTLAPRRRNLAWIGVWATIFVAMSAAQAVGDAHPGHRVPFWRQACQDNKRLACENLGLFVSTYCEDGSGWACNERGVLRFEGKLTDASDPRSDFSKSCAMGFRPACQNVAMLIAQGKPRRADPVLQDYPIILRSGKGAIQEHTPSELFGKACDQGWLSGCENLGLAYLRGQGVPRDPSRAAAELDKACTAGSPTSCSDVGYMYHSADGVAHDEAKAIAYLTKACNLGYASACKWRDEQAAAQAHPTESSGAVTR